jgi:hypothetical protein
MGDLAAWTLVASEYACSPKADHVRLMINGGNLARIDTWIGRYVRFRVDPYATAFVKGCAMSALMHRSVCRRDDATRAGVAQASREETAARPDAIWGS